MKTFLLAAAAAGALCAGAAQASIIPVLSSVVANGDGTFTYSYTGTLAADQGVVGTGVVGPLGPNPPSELVIFDFAGYVPGSITGPANVLVSTQLTSPLALPSGGTDNPSITNLVFTYNGPAFNNTGGPAAAPTLFSGLSAKSTFGLAGQGDFSAIAVKNTGAQANTPTFNQGFVSVPVATGGVPEPASWALMIMGFGGLGAVLRRKRLSIASGVA